MSTRHIIQSVKCNMAFLKNGSPRIFLMRRTVTLCGVSGCVLLIMYISASNLVNNSAQGGAKVSSVAPPPQPTSSSFSDYWNSAEEEDQDDNQFSEGILTPDGLHSNSINKQSELQPTTNKNRRSDHDGYQPPSWSSNNLANPSPKKILIWNSYWNSKALWHKIFRELFYKQCPQSNCVLTIDRSQASTSDAILFHLVNVVQENYTFPENRNPNQIWIGMSYEPPYILEFIGLDFKRLNGVFNRTMSYRTDGDIVVRHGTFYRIRSPPSIPTYASNWVNSHDPIETRNYAEGKRRLVAWFASSRNCVSQSGREKYVKELQNYIEVDVYGRCGPYKCGVQKTMRNPYKVEEDDCYMLLSVGYKFVLAFENSLCEDYVTEKLYNHLKLNIVPVVLGASNYSMFAPPHSVIEASQYTPEELAEYLQQLDRNDTAYNEYFRWKQDYAVEAHDGVPLACDLCEQLHNPNWQVERKVYDQFDKWIVSGCRKGYGEL